MNAAAVKYRFRPETVKEAPGELDPPGGGIGELLEKTIRVRRPVLGVERAVLPRWSAFLAACATNVPGTPTARSTARW
jgi:hypothetical protein